MMLELPNLEQVSPSKLTSQLPISMLCADSNRLGMKVHLKPKAFGTGTEVRKF